MKESARASARVLCVRSPAGRQAMKIHFLKPRGDSEIRQQLDGLALA